MALSTTSTLGRIEPEDVHRSLGRYVLADGLPIVFDFERSHGSWVYDSKTGRELLDFLTFFGSGPIGYNHPKMREPRFLEVLHRVAQLKPSLSDLYCVEYAWFVDTVGRLAMPAHMAHAFFIEGGTLGVENALKIAFDWKVRRNRATGVRGDRGSQIVHFREAFHGRSGYGVSLTNTDPAKIDLFPKFSWPRIENPKLRFPVTPQVEADVAAAEQRALDEIERAFADNADDIAAILIEPIQAEGGDHHFRAGFLQALERTAHDHECLFIVDEVQTGVGLTGRMWAFEHFGLKPDALAFGKKMQVCGCFAGPKVDEEPENVFRVPSRINSTFGGGLTDMVRSARYLEIIDEDRLVENARSVGEELLAGLLTLQDEMGGRVSGARGRGLMIAFDLPTPEMRKRAIAAALDENLLLLPCGSRSIRFRPPLNLSKAEADSGLERLRAALKRL